MKVYRNTGYGFCKVCKKTSELALFFKADGKVVPVCPTCAERQSVMAVEVKPSEGVVDEVCCAEGCMEAACAQCVTCGDVMCLKHEFEENCASCHATKRNYDKWTNRYHEQPV